MNGAPEGELEVLHRWKGSRKFRCLALPALCLAAG